MPTKKKSKIQFGAYKLEPSSDKVVKLGNGLVLKVFENPTVPGKIDSIGMFLNGQDVMIPASHIVQAGAVLSSIDRSKRFVCGFHGSFESPPGRAQTAACGKCLSEKIAAHTATVDEGSAALEEDDG